MPTWQDISCLEEYIDHSKMVTVNCSDGYFTSRNCMRELCQAARRKKPIIALIDGDEKKGGLSLEAVREAVKASQPNLESWDFFAPTLPSSRTSARYSHVTSPRRLSQRSSHVGPPSTLPSPCSQSRRTSLTKPNQRRQRAQEPQPGARYSSEQQSTRRSTDRDDMNEASIAFHSLSSLPSVRNNLNSTALVLPLSATMLHGALFANEPIEYAHTRESTRLRPCGWNQPLSSRADADGSPRDRLRVTDGRALAPFKM
jgi:hypothetical protein